MASDRLPFFLHEAQISLYLADSTGQPAGNALWFGGFVNGFKSGLSLDEVLIKGSGDAYATAHHVDENHVLNLDQTWLIYTPTLTDWKPVRNQQYVLQLLWAAGGYWLSRTYYGVTWRELGLESVDTKQIIEKQVLRAQYYTDESGSVQSGTQPAATVTNPLPGAVQSLAFFRENALITGEYLLGFFSWTATVTLGSAVAVASAPLVTPQVLELEVDGVLTGQTLTLPVGAANTEVSAAASLSWAVQPGQLVRWKIVSGPVPVNAADSCSLALAVTS